MIPRAAKTFFVLLLLTGWWLFGFSPVAAAAAEKINDFNVEITAGKSGVLLVTERIAYDFAENERHGIFREIPTTRKLAENLWQHLEIKPKTVLRNGQPENYSFSEDSNQVRFKIGRQEKTLTGLQTYTLIYEVGNAIGNFADHDEIYWNATGNGWQVPILRATAEIKTDFGVLPEKVGCYTGAYGSHDLDCRSAPSSPFNPTVLTRTLKPGEGLTVVWGFPLGTFPKSIFQKTAPTGSSQTLSFGVIFLYLLLPLLILIWYLKNKRKERFGPPVPNFDFPEDEEGKRLIPAEAGTIDSAVLERDDVLATIFDLAIRKYIKLEQVKEEFFIKKLKSYEDVAPPEKVLLDRLFRDLEVIEVSSLKKDFYETFQELDKEVFTSLVEKKYYTKNPKVQRGLLLTGTIIAGVTLNLFLAAVLFLLYKKLIGRTALGDQRDWKIDGLKLFLKNMSRNYKWQAEKLYVVEKMIPYAMALGYIDKFMEQLKIIYPDYKPDWYSGNLAFYAISSSMFDSMNSTFTTTAPSSSSGFGGGGFSGGGGGGGGGGSW